MATQRPQDLVFTLYGDFLLHRHEPVWAGSLITLLEPLGLSQGAVRTVLSRMAAKGWLRAERHGRHSFYDLTRQGRRLLEEGKQRIYDPPRDEPWDRRWYLVTYTIPEDQRHLRDRLRVRLTWLGCGSLGNGVWVSPHDILEPVAEIATDLEVRDRLEVFRAEHRGFSDAERLVAQCWNLPEVNARYEQFVARHWPEYERCKAELERGALSPEAAYVGRFALVHEYREFPLVDPYLPRTLLPQEWAGDCSAALFNAFHDMLMPLADRYVDGILASARKRKPLPKRKRGPARKRAASPAAASRCP